MKTTAAKLARNRDHAQVTAKLQRTLTKKHCPGQKIAKDPLFKSVSTKYPNSAII